jgi:hypothetical protein
LQIWSPPRRGCAKTWLKIAAEIQRQLQNKKPPLSVAEGGFLARISRRVFDSGSKAHKITIKNNNKVKKESGAFLVQLFAQCA